MLSTRSNDSKQAKISHVSYSAPWVDADESSFLASVVPSWEADVAFDFDIYESIDWTHELSVALQVD